MKYKILPNTHLFQALTEIRQRGLQADNAAIEWVTNYFGENKPRVSPNHAAWGGLVAIELDHKPDGWKRVGQDWQRLYAPKATQKQIYKEWDALPVVTNNEVKDMLNYGSYVGMKDGRLTSNTMPGLVFSDDYILIETSCLALTYVPVDGMIEILESEFNALRNAVVRKEETAQAT